MEAVHRTSMKRPGGIAFTFIEQVPTARRRERETVRGTEGKDRGREGKGSKKGGKNDWRRRGSPPRRPAR